MTRCFCCRSCRGLICFLSTNEEDAGGERELDCRRFLGAATALVLRDRSCFRGGDHDGDGRRFEAATAVAATAVVRRFVAATAVVVRRNDGHDNDRRFVTATAVAATAVVRRFVPSTAVAATAVVRRNGGRNNDGRFVATTAVAATAVFGRNCGGGRNGGRNCGGFVAATAVVLTERSSSRSLCVAILHITFLLGDSGLASVSDKLTELELLRLREIRCFGLF